MRAITTFAVLVVLQSALFGCVASPVDPQHLGAQTPPPSFTVDPQANPEVWGVYSRLVGHRYAPPTGGFPGFEVRWSEPGKAIIETSLFLEGAIVGPDVKWSRTIRPGSKAGELNMDFNGTPWLGTIESDGSVVFKAVTPRSGDFPYRIRLSSRGEMLVQNWLAVGCHLLNALSGRIHAEWSGLNRGRGVARRTTHDTFRLGREAAGAGAEGHRQAG